MQPEQNQPHSQPIGQPHNPPQRQAPMPQQNQAHSQQASGLGTPIQQPVNTQTPAVTQHEQQHRPNINSIYPANSVPETGNSQNFNQNTAPNNSGVTNQAGQNFNSPFGSNQTQASDPAPNSNAGLMVLQWLTYAFWGWTVLALSVLTGLVVQSLMSSASYSYTGDATLYSLAAVLVLLPVSFVCETLYSKREQPKKTGGPLAIMAIHAVIFALFGIGTLIFAAFSIVQMMTSNSSDKGASISLITSLIIAVYYAVTFLRTLNFPAIPWFAKYYRFFMLITVGILAILGIVGPMAKDRSTRNDRLIESNLSYVSSAVNSYATKNKTLPDKLSNLTLSGDAKKLVDDNLVEYKKESTGTTDSLKNSLNNSTNKYSSSTYSIISLRYQLCVTYKQKSSRPSYAADTSSQYDTTDGYTNYLTTYGHQSGNVCYKLKTSSY